MTVLALLAAAAVLLVVAAVAALTAPVLLGGALRGRTLPPVLGSWLVVVGAALGSLVGEGLARAVATALTAPSGAGAVLAAVAALVIVPVVVAPAAAAAGALVLLVVVAWLLRHATPEPVHRRARVLAVISTALLAMGAGTQIGQVGLALVLIVTGDGAASVQGPAPASATLPHLLVAAAVAVGALGGLLGPRAARRAPLAGREPLTVLVEDSCATAVLLLASALALPVPAAVVVLAARAGGDLTRTSGRAGAVRWRALARR